MSLRRHTPRQFEDFFRALDGELRRPFVITVIGGAAIGLRYDPSHATTDIDLTPVSDAQFWAAVERAQAHLAEPIPVESASIFQPPYEYEARRAPLKIAGLKRLQVLVPEVHDLALMKVARGETPDLQAIEDIHRRTPLRLETLIERYFETRTRVIGSLEEFRLSFLALTERLFGAERASEVETRLATVRPPSDHGV